MAALSAVAAGVSIAATAAGTGMSFAQAGKQRKLQRQAEAEADRAMQEAKKKLEVNYYEELGIAKEPFELQREAMNQQAAAALEAIREGDVRGVAAGAGRIQMAQQQGQAEIRAAMAQQMMELDQLKAAEESRLRDVGVGLNLEEVAGAQEAAANAQEMAAQATEQGIEGATSLVGQLSEFAPLFEKTASMKQLGKLEQSASKVGVTGAELQNQLAAFGEANAPFSSLSGVGSGKMNYNQFADFIGKVSPRTLKSLRGKFTPKKPK